MSRRSNWYGCKEWTKYGLPFSTTSNQAMKLYDAALTQHAGYYNDVSLGGLTETLNKLLETEPTNVMGHVLSIGAELLADYKCSPCDGKLRNKVNVMLDLVKGSTVSDWEKQHVKAIELLADCHMFQSTKLWDQILVEYPLDYLAIWFNFDCCLYMGSAPERHGFLAGIVQQWKPDMPLYGYVLGMYAFSLCEVNDLSKAEILAKKSLEINPLDAWSTHGLTHAYDAQGKLDDALNLLGSTVQEWSSAEMLATHNYWHWAIANLEKGNYDTALEIYDSQLIERALKGRTSWNVCDCSSLLYRLKMEGVKVGDRWDDVYEVCQPKLEGDRATFFDPHFIMTCLGAKRPNSATQMMAAMEEFTQETNQTHGQTVKKEVCVALCQSLIACDEGDHQRAVELLLPIRYNVYRIGGSNAQRDIVNLFLIDVAMKSPLKKHNKLGRMLLFERREAMEESPLTDRLLTKFVISH